MTAAAADNIQLRCAATSSRAKGCTDAEIDKILGGNTLRVMEQVEATAARLQR